MSQDKRKRGRGGGEERGGVTKLSSAKHPASTSLPRAQQPTTAGPRLAPLPGCPVVLKHADVEKKTKAKEREKKKKRLLRVLRRTSPCGFVVFFCVKCLLGARPRDIRNGESLGGEGGSRTDALLVNTAPGARGSRGGRAREMDFKKTKFGR